MAVILTKQLCRWVSAITMVFVFNSLDVTALNTKAAYSSGWTMAVMSQGQSLGWLLNPAVTKVVVKVVIFFRTRAAAEPGGNSNFKSKIYMT